MSEEINEAEKDLVQALESLIGYLKNHEQDIAIGENDFSDLRDIFVYFIEREPVSKDL